MPLDWREVRRILRERLGGDTRFEGWRPFHGFSGEEYAYEIPPNVTLRNPFRSDGWLYNEDESHLVLLEFEGGGSPVVNVVKISWYASEGGTFQELSAFSAAPPRTVTLAHFYQQTTGSEYEPDLAMFAGRLFTETAEEGSRRYHFHESHETEPVWASEESFAEWVTECLSDDLFQPEQ